MAHYWWLIRKSATIDAASESCKDLIGLHPLFPLTFDGRKFAACSRRNVTGQYLIDIEPDPSGNVERGPFLYDIRSGLEDLWRLDSSVGVCSAAAQLIRMHAVMRMALTGVSRACAASHRCIFNT
jgi:hypothetical protein